MYGHFLDLRDPGRATYLWNPPRVKRRATAAARLRALVVRAELETLRGLARTTGGARMAHTHSVGQTQERAQDGRSAGRADLDPDACRGSRGERTHAREFVAATLTLGSRCSTVRNGAWLLRALRLRRVCERVSTRFRADPENVDNVRFGLTPHNPPG